MYKTCSIVGRKVGKVVNGSQKRCFCSLPTTNCCCNWGWNPADTTLSTAEWEVQLVWKSKLSHKSKVLLAVLPMLSCSEPNYGVKGNNTRKVNISCAVVLWLIFHLRGLWHPAWWWRDDGEHHDGPDSDSNRPWDRPLCCPHSWWQCPQILPLPPSTITLLVGKM